MKLSLKNIGLLKEAELEINGITVIAGLNGTAKSTVSKSLYTIFNGMSQINKKIEGERLKSLHNLFTRYFEATLSESYLPGFVIRDELKELLVEWDRTKEVSLVLVKKIFSNTETFLNDINSVEIESFNERILSDLDSLKKDIEELLEVDIEVLQNRILTAQVRNEFSDQIMNFDMKDDEDSMLKLKIKDSETVFNIKENIVAHTSGIHQLEEQCVYIDNPYVIDNLGGYAYRFSALAEISTARNHTSALKMMLQLQMEEQPDLLKEIIIEDKFQEINEVLKEIGTGDLQNNKGKTFYVKEGRKLDLRNVSLGLKTFIILKTLIEKGKIKENGLIILDEPEIHLHPEWQILFAKLIVLLQKTFGLHILLTTHSPYFLQAIEEYSKKYKINDICDYYINEFNGSDIEVRNLNNNLEDVYEKFLAPYKKLDKVNSIW